MKFFRYITAAALTSVLLASCTTDFPRQEIETANLSGFIEGGNAGGIYGDAGLTIDADSIKMADWQISRLTTSINALLDTTLVDQTGFSDFYTVQIKNKGQLSQREFIDSLVVVLSDKGLIK